jgi:hypothetical protein
MRRTRRARKLPCRAPPHPSPVCVHARSSTKYATEWHENHWLPSVQPTMGPMTTTPDSSADQPRRIDLHHHFFPSIPGVEPAKAANTIFEQTGWPMPESNYPWSPATSIAAMDRLGIEKAVLSLPQGGRSADADDRRFNSVGGGPCQPAASPWKSSQSRMYRARFLPHSPPVSVSPPGSVSCWSQMPFSRKTSA